MSAFVAFLASCITLVSPGVIHYPQEVHLANVRQLTFGGANAEAYFSFDNKKLIFQAAAFGSQCDQIFTLNLDAANMPIQPPDMVSTGLGVCTCSYFMPDSSHFVYASTFNGGNLKCPTKICKSTESKTNSTLQRLCNTTYTWDIFPDFDVFKANSYGHIDQQLTHNVGYDAEATCKDYSSTPSCFACVSPKFDRIVFTSTRSGDLELWTMNLDGSNMTQITNTLGYDGGAFFSPDGTKLIYRASRPKTDQEKQKYKELLSFNLVSPTDMELFTINADGTNMKQITNLGGANWAPFYHPDGKRVIFSSNHASSGFDFNLYMVNDDGSNIERITFDPNFDAFPMFSFDAKLLVFASSRNASKPHEINLFLADWINNVNHTTSASSRLVVTVDRVVLGVVTVMFGVFFGRF